MSGISPLWRIFYYSGSVIAQQIKDKITGGDETNPASYVLERFYRAGPSVDELTLLAAHFVLEGKDFSAQISGLDVVVSKEREEPVFLTDREIEMLRERSLAIREKVGKALTSAVTLSSTEL